MMKQESTIPSESLGLFSSVKKFTAKGSIYFISVFLLFGLINTIFLIISLIKFKPVETFSTYLLYVAIIVIIGVLFNALGVYLTYKHLLTEGINTIYKLCQPLFKKLSSVIVDKTSSFTTDKMKITDNNIQKTFDIGNIISETYGKRVPNTVKKGISYIIARIPFSDLLFNIKDSIKERDKDKAGVLLYEQIDMYVTSSILTSSSMKFMYWIAPLNIIIQCVVIYFINNNITPQTFDF